MSGPPDTLSVVIPNYNHARFLPDSIDSILHQSRPPDEIIVVDDASSDNSVEILRAYAARDDRIRLILSETNRGVMQSLRAGVEACSGRYFFGGAADDRILPGLFERSMALLRRYPEAGLCSAQSLVMDESLTRERVFATPEVVSRPAFLPPARVRELLRLYGSWFMGNTTIYRREAFLAAGGYMPDLQFFADGFVSQAMALRHGACYLPEPLAIWRKMDEGFASASMNDEERVASVMVHVRRLEQTGFRGLFPPGHTDRIEEDFRLAAQRRALSRQYRPRPEEGAGERVARWLRLWTARLGLVARFTTPYRFRRYARTLGPYIAYRLGLRR